MEPETIGSAGTLVAAGLATAGQYLQSAFLDMMEKGFANRVGFLFFLLASVSGLVGYALTGKFGQALWLLIAPPIVFTCLFLRIESGGTEWKVENTINQRRLVKETLVGVYGPKTGVVEKGIAEKPIRVSVFFAKWDGVTSGISNAFIRFLALIEPASEKFFLNRTERYMSLFNKGIPDQEVSQFYLQTFFPLCLDWVMLKQAAANPSEIVDKAKFEARAAQLNNLIVVGSADRGYELIRQLNERKAFGDTVNLNPAGYTCSGLWELAFQSARVMAGNVVTERVLSNIPAGTTPDEVMQQVARKFGTDNKYDAADYAQMLNAVAARMLLQASMSLPQNLAREDQQRAVSDPKSKDMFHQGALREGSRIRTYTAFQEYRGKGEFLTYMLGLPYVQGMGYFMLSLAFPIFALMMIFPKKMGALLLWMQLWAWLKAWDFGFAVVMMMDNVFYYLLPRGPAMTDKLLSDPSQAFKVVLSADPSYSADLYFNITATMLAAVPILTGALVGRGGSQFVNMLIRGTDSFAGRMGGSFTAFAASWRGQDLLRESEAEKVQAAVGARSSLLQDPEARAAATLAGFSGAFGGSTPGIPGAFFGALKEEGTRFGKEWLGARVSEVSTTAAYQNSIGDSQIERSQELTRTGFAYHDLTDPMPLKEVSMLEAIRRGYRFGGAIDKALMSTWVGAIGTRKGTFQAVDEAGNVTKYVGVDLHLKPSQLVGGIAKAGVLTGAAGIGAAEASASEDTTVVPPGTARPPH